MPGLRHAAVKASNACSNRWSPPSGSGRDEALLAVFVGARSRVFFEFFVEPVYFRITDGVRYLIDFHFGGFQQQLRLLHAPQQQVFVEGHIFMLLEFLSEIGTVKVQYIGNPLKCNIPVQLFLHIELDLFDD